MINLKDIGVSYDKKNYILENLSLEIGDGELVSLLGPSGCGKTTTLRVIAGLIHPSKGRFFLDDADMTDIPVHKRNFGMVFQSYALFPHLTIYENIAFGLKLKKEDKETIAKKVAEVVEVCGLSGLENRYPKQLSGGQRQRVALARAIIIEPKLLLLDEPLSNLDAKLRLSMRLEIKRIQKALGITTVFVTHDQEECFSISDKVAIMNKGIIEQYDTPENIYRYPKTKFVASFIGFENFMEAKKKADGKFILNNGMEYEASSLDAGDATDVILTIRPEDIRIGKESSPNRLKADIRIRTFLGKAYQYEVETEVGTLLITCDDRIKYEIGDTVYLEFPKEKLIALYR